MQVVKDSVVTLDYNVTDPDGVLVDAGKEPLVYLHGGHEDIFPKIEEALQAKKKRKGTYGALLFKQLGKHLGIQPRTLYDCKKVAERFSHPKYRVLPAAVKNLCWRGCRNGEAMMPRVKEVGRRGR